MDASSMDLEQYAVAKEIMRAHFTAKGAGENLGTDRAASSTTAKGEGKIKGIGKQSSPD